MCRCQASIAEEGRNTCEVAHLDSSRSQRAGRHPGFAFAFFLCYNTNALYIPDEQSDEYQKTVITCCAGVSELADEADSKSVGGNVVWVRVPPPA